tara:strand:+ start:2030 stop:3406 length:1377 start_codon:yes stop_codon:yes gene_type:complete
MNSQLISSLKLLRKILTGVLTLVIFISFFAYPSYALNDGQQLVLESWSLINEGYLNPERLDEIHWKRLRQKALEKTITNSEQAYEAIETMLNPIGDPYTRLLRPNDYKAMKESNLGSEINGVGLQLGARNQDGKIVVIAPLEGSPASDAEISSGTILLKVNGESPQNLGLEATASRLRGESGSQAIIEIETPSGEIKELKLDRRSVDLRPVRTKRLRNESHTIGYLRITQFSEVVPEQVKEAIEELSQKDIEGLILDLRNNSGGLVSSGIAVANAFLSNKPIVETKNNLGINDPIPASKQTLYDGPMITLVNEGTASASEILAGSLQDNERSELIGSKTFGKGLIQSLSTLSDGSGLAITVASYLTPNGIDIQNQGIEPNKVLEIPQPVNIGGSEDRWLQDAELLIGALLDRNKSEELNQTLSTDANDNLLTVEDVNQSDVEDVNQLRNEVTFSSESE